MRATQVRSGKVARVAHARTSAALCAGGQVQFLKGTRPADPDGQAAVANIMARCALPPAPAVGDDGVAAIGPLNATIERPGEITWWRLLTPDGSVVHDGSVGVKSGDIRMTRTEFLAGDELRNVRIALAELADQ